MDRSAQRVLSEYLILGAQAGDRRALEALVQRWTPRLLRYASRTVGSTELAKDIVQDTWMVFVRALNTLDDPARFPAWIYAIAHRKCADAVRRLGRQRRLSAAFDAQPKIDSHTGTHETSMDLQRAMKDLALGHREVVSLFYGEDLDVEEIAMVLGIPRGTVKSRLFNARRQLRERLGGNTERGD